MGVEGVWWQFNSSNARHTRSDRSNILRNIHERVGIQTQSTENVSLETWFCSVTWAHGACASTIILDMLWPEHLCDVGYSMRTMMITMMTARCDLDGIDGSGRQSAPVHKGTHPMQNITACIMHTLVYMQMHVCVCVWQCARCLPAKSVKQTSASSQRRELSWAHVPHANTNHTGSTRTRQECVRASALVPPACECAWALL